MSVISIPFVWLPLAFVPLVAWSKDAAVVALAGAALLVLTARDRRAAVLAGLRPTAAVLLGAAFFAWALASVAWSPTHRMTDWVKAVPIVLSAWVLGRSLAHVPAEAAAGLARPALGAVVALVSLLTVERVTGGSVIGLARPGDATDRLFDLLSPGLALLSCLLFPAARLAESVTGRRWTGGLLIGVSFVLALTYRMDAAPVAIACGAISYGIARTWGRAGVALVAAGIAVVALSWGPVAALAWRHGDQVWLTAHANLNWGYRVEIWNRVHDLIGARPGMGYGFDSARVLAQGAGVTFLHPHNGLLQVWLELGAVGVALLLAWAAVSLRGYLSCARESRALATCAATMTAVAVFWLVSFGIWQGWWLAAIGLAFSACALAQKDVSPSRTR